MQSVMQREILSVITAIYYYNPVSTIIVKALNIPTNKIYYNEILIYFSYTL